MRNSSVYVALDRGEALATLTLCAKKPWAIDRRHFTDCRKPLYLTGMAVDPKRQRQGIGRRSVDEVRRIAKEWSSDAIRLDSYDAVAGAGTFYEKCGFREVGRALYRNCPLIYYEMLL